MLSAGRTALGTHLESPFSHLLCTNTVPSDAECDAIRQFLSELKKNFVAVIEETARMQAVLSNLTDQCERLRDSIDAHQAVVSLARRLPEDVLREIFLACLPSAGNPVMSSCEAPMLLIQVCSNWRKIAFATPQLWSSLHVVVPNVARLRNLSAAVDAWLTRSGVLPLSITLAVSAACEPGSDNVATMLDVLANFSRRWRRIKITLAPRTILTPLTNLHASDVPILESIAFASIGSGFWQNLVTPFDIPWQTFNFLRTPSIRSASFASLGGNLLGLTLPWPFLQSLSLTAGNIKDSSSFHLTATIALVILRQCPNLKRCILCITSDRNSVEDDPETRPPPLILSRLKEFKVDNREHSQVNGIFLFRSLRVPELKSFGYMGPKYGGQLPFISMFSAIHTLEKLTIDIKGLARVAFLNCLELLPSLTSLRLEGGGDYDPWSSPSAHWGRENPLANANDILRHLTPDPRISNDCPCPFLTQLEVMRCQPLADDVVFNFVQIRAEVGHPLEYVCVAFTRQMEFDMMPHLRELVAQGLKIYLKYLPAPALPTYSPWEGRDAMA
ncbi:hypothetical protein C8F04DRAFT_130437 [Mycena alexandri]|uniref:F-box domain-containing protein n=1 Tax=Mycena alexandri TaxID=1745969 RepID=A0AAD6TAD8_9AGAR|nr:hypothetical protein C8F04DRAFT_130437 [Mycena alexandri]